MLSRTMFLAAGIVSILTATRAMADPSCADPTGDWHNQLGSTLTVSKVDKTTGQITGSYISPSGTQGDSRPLVGWLQNTQGDPSKKHQVGAVSFAVHWGPYGSITSWTGKCETLNGTPTIFTLWHLVRTSSDFAWDHLLAGSDTFTPGAPVKPAVQSKPGASKLKEQK